MRKIVSFCFSILFVLLVWSCDNQKDFRNRANAETRIFQQEDGSFYLKLEKATCYNDKVNPSSNTAEWSVVVTKSGRYNVWLSSATKDTTDLSYSNSVRISLLENRIERDPEIDKIVRNSVEVSYPYFRADSYMGSFFIPEPGEYTIQVISEKIISKESHLEKTTFTDNTEMMSLILIPLTR
jgi:hypothetical protein